MKAGNLYDDAVVGQAVNERVWQSFGHDFPVVVIRLVPYIEDRFLDVPHLMPQQIDGHHGNGMLVGAVFVNVTGVFILDAQVLPETKRLCGNPCLLQFYKDKMLAAV